MNDKWLFHCVNIVLAGTLLSLTVCSQTTDNSDNSDVKRFEIAGHISGLFVNRIDASDEVFKNNGFPNARKNDRFLDIGFGGRFTYNLSRRLAVEGEANYFRSDPTLNERALLNPPVCCKPFSGGKKTQFLAGVKYGIRRSKYGVFGKARPGVIRFTAYPKVIALFFSPLRDDMVIFSAEAPATFFNIDFGGVFEYYPSRRTVVRVDVGDTIIRYSAQKPKEINPSFTRNNLQVNIGFGFRF